MHDLSEGDLAIRQRTVSLSAAEGGRDAVLELTWLGRSVDQQPREKLAPYFQQALSEALTDRARLELHFERLEHVNSSTITAIIQFIQEAKSRKVPVTVVFDPTRRWQRLSFEALRVLSGGGLELRSV